MRENHRWTAEALTSAVCCIPLRTEGAGAVFLLHRTMHVSGHGRQGVNPKRREERWSMRTIIVKPYMRIQLGKQGENHAAQVVWRGIAAEYAALYGGGTFTLTVRRCGDGEAYPVNVTVSGGNVVWEVSAADTARAGTGSCELTYTVNGTTAKSRTWDTWVSESVSGSGTAEPPEEPAKAWFLAVQAQIGDLRDLTTKAKDSLVAAINEAAKSGGGGTGGVSMAVTEGKIRYSTDGGESWEDLIALEELKGAQGEKGAQGAPGAAGKDGVTPHIQIGTVTTLEAGSDATASIGGTPEEPLLNLGIPKGADGSNFSGFLPVFRIYAKADTQGNLMAYRDQECTVAADTQDAAHLSDGSDIQLIYGTKIYRLSGTSASPLRGYFSRMDVTGGGDAALVLRADYAAWSPEEYAAGTVTAPIAMKRYQAEVMPAVGDVNGDGLVDKIDAYMIRAYTRSELTLSEAAIARADYNGDGLVNARDTMAIMEKVNSEET